MFLTLFFSGLLIISILFLWNRRKYYILQWKIGGPLGYPFLGVGLQFLDQENILKYMTKLHNKYGSVIFGFLGLFPVFVVSDPISCEKILASQAFVSKSFIYHGVKVALGDGLFTSEGSRWNQHRKLLNPAFNHKILLSFLPIFNKEIKIFNNKLKYFINKGPVDLTLLFKICALDISCQTTMGKEMNFQTGKNVDIVHAYEDLLNYTAQRIFTPWYVSDFLYSFFPAKKLFFNAVETINNFVDELIQIKAQTRVSEPKHIDDNTTDDEFKIVKSKNIFLEQAFNLMANNNFNASDVRDESNTMVVAAYETTANSIYTVLMCLAMFPEYQERVFDEIISIFPDKDFEATYEDTQQMVYSEMVINETMRLLSPVPLVARKCTEDFDFGNGIKIPRGTQIVIDIFNMHRCEKIWGPKAKTFDPDHFLKDNISLMHPYSFIPFTKGLRNCIGWRHGLMSLKVFLAQILRSYRFTTNFKFEDLRYAEGITLKFVKTPLLEVYARQM